MPDLKILAVENKRHAARDLTARLRALGYELTGPAISIKSVMHEMPPGAPSLIIAVFSTPAEKEDLDSLIIQAEDVKAPVIFIPDSDPDNTAQLLGKSGADFVLNRPFSDRDLVRMIDSALAVYEGGDLNLRNDNQLEAPNNTAPMTEDKILKTIFEKFPAAIFIWQYKDDDFTLINYNQAADALTFGEAPNMIGGRASSLYSKYPEILKDFKICMHKKTSFRRETPPGFFAGSRDRRLEVNYVYLPPDLLLTYIADETKRIRAEEKLKLSEERFRTIADYTYDWEYWQGPDDNYYWVSPACERITGYTPENFYSDPALFFSIVHPEDIAEVKSFCDKQSKKETVYHLDFRIISKDGRVRWISHHCQPVYGVDGSWQGRRASNRDISGRKETEARLIAYQHQLRMLASELTLAEERERRSIAVDLHDRVGHTLAMSQIKLNQFQMMSASPETAEALEDVVRLIESAIADTRNLTLEISPPSLYELGLEAALDELGHDIQDRHGIRTDVWDDDGLPKPLNNDARVAIYRAVRELMINVVKHARARHLQVSLETKGKSVAIKVVDDGMGFDFDEALADDAKRKSFGLLSIRERIRHLGGSIDVVSNPGEGTTITILAPLSPTGD